MNFFLVVSGSHSLAAWRTSRNSSKFDKPPTTNGTSAEYHKQMLTHPSYDFRLTHLFQAYGMIPTVNYQRKKSIYPSIIKAKNESWVIFRLDYFECDIE